MRFTASSAFTGVTPGTQSREAIEIMVVDRRRIIGLKRQAAAQTRAIRMADAFGITPMIVRSVPSDHDRAAEHVAT